MKLFEQRRALDNFCVLCVLLLNSLLAQSVLLDSLHSCLDQTTTSYKINFEIGHVIYAISRLFRNFQIMKHNFEIAQIYKMRGTYMAFNDN